MDCVYRGKLGKGAATTLIIELYLHVVLITIIEIV